MKQKFAIFGAHMIAVSFYRAVKQLDNCIPVCFVVSEKEMNPIEIEGVRVLTIEKFVIAHKDVKIIVATPPNHFEAVKDMLEKHNIFDLEFLTFEKFDCVMRKFYALNNMFQLVPSKQMILHSDNKENMEHKVQIYMAIHEKDNSLKYPYEENKLVKQIQVGAAASQKKIASLQDHTGINISEKNIDYCELTATYWIWNNVQSYYKGICHYRRVFDVTGEQILQSHADVILPYPMFYIPTIMEHHKRYINEKLWNVICEVVQKSVGSKRLDSIMTDHYFYNFNMVVARNEVFGQYSEWLFRMLMEIESLCRQRGIQLHARWAGYVAENLTTIYWRLQENNLTIMHTGVKILT